MNYNKGDKVKVTNGLGEVLEGVFLRLDYKKDPKHYAVEMKFPTNMSKNGYRKTVWYLPESRFVK